MSAFPVITERVAQVTTLAAGFLAQAAAGLVNNAEALSVDEMSRRLDGALRALRGEEVSTPPLLSRHPRPPSTITIERMEAELRAADCLYDDTKLWKQLGATEVPQIPDAVIQEAYAKGGRVILRCSSISEKAEALKSANHSVVFSGSAQQSNYQESVSKPEWILVPSDIDESTLGRPKIKVVTSEMPAPTPEDWFSAIAYARLDGGRQPKGCQGLYAFTTKSGEVVGSRDDRIDVHRNVHCDRRGSPNLGAGRFGPPRN
jgi:hypothetical protein